jgi:hypothetical protein
MKLSFDKPLIIHFGYFIAVGSLSRALVWPWEDDAPDLPASRCGGALFLEVVEKRLLV